MIRYRYAAVDGKTIVCREGWPANAPAIRLPFPSSLAFLVGTAS